MEYGHITTKDEVLSALLLTWKSEFGNEDFSHEWDTMLTSLKNRAVELGATRYEIMRTQFEAGPEDMRQHLLNAIVDDLEISLLPETLNVLADLSKIKIEFGLHDPFTGLPPTK